MPKPRTGARWKGLLALACINALYATIGSVGWHNPEAPGLGPTMLTAWLVAVVLTLVFVPYRPPLTKRELEQATRHGRTYVDSVTLRGCGLLILVVLLGGILKSMVPADPSIPFGVFSAFLGWVDALIARSEMYRWRDRRAALPTGGSSSI